MAGGVTAANFPQIFKNSRRSLSSISDMVSPHVLWIFQRLIIKLFIQIINRIMRSFDQEV